MDRSKKNLNKKSIPDNLRARTRELNGRLVEAVHAFEQNDVRGSIEKAESVLDDATELFNTLSVHYREALFKGKVQAFTDEKSTLETLKSGGGGKDDADRLVQVLTRLDDMLTLAEKEIDHNYPQPFPLWPFLVRNRKHVVIAFAAVLVLAACLLTWRTIQLKRTGLTGAYFSGTNFQNMFRQRSDRQIDFNWGMESPVRGWRRDDFSVRWTGFLRVPKSGAYTFITHSDDGVRVKINDTVVIENWTVHRLAVNQGVINLSEGVHPITVEYFEAKRRAILRLLWKFESEPKPSVIPASALAPNEKYAMEK